MQALVQAGDSSAWLEALCYGGSERQRVSAGGRDGAAGDVQQSNAAPGNGNVGSATAEVDGVMVVQGEGSGHHPLQEEEVAGSMGGAGQGIRGREECGEKLHVANHHPPHPSEATMQSPAPKTTAGGSSPCGNIQEPAEKAVQQQPEELRARLAVLDVALVRARWCEVRRGMYAESQQALRRCLEGDFKHFHRARFRLAWSYVLWEEGEGGEGDGANKPGVAGGLVRDSAVGGDGAGASDAGDAATVPPASLASPARPVAPLSSAGDRQAQAELAYLFTAGKSAFAFNVWEISPRAK